MYTIIRLIIGGAILAVLLVLISKFAVRRKILLRVFAFLFSVALVTALNFLPFENLFYTFDSAEASYEYTYFGKSNVKVVVEGDKCDLVVDRVKRNSNTHLIVPKTEKGWKIGRGIDSRTVSYYFSDSVSVDVYRYKNTNDYFICAHGADDKALDISDNRNSEIHSLTSWDDDSNYERYYWHVSDLDSTYKLVINGTDIPLNLS